MLQNTHTSLTSPHQRITNAISLKHATLLTCSRAKILARGLSLKDVSTSPSWYLHRHGASEPSKHTRTLATTHALLLSHLTATSVYAPGLLPSALKEWAISRLPVPVCIYVCAHMYVSASLSIFVIKFPRLFARTQCAQLIPHRCFNNWSVMSFDTNAPGTSSRIQNKPLFCVTLPLLNRP